MKAKGAGSMCVLEGCVMDDYFARIHTPSYNCCLEMYLYIDLLMDGRTKEGMKERTDE